MNKPSRTRLIGAIKADHANYLSGLAGLAQEQTLKPRFRNLERKLLDLLRRTEGSANSLKGIPTLSRLIFGIQEDIQRLGLPVFSFTREKEAVNRFIISALDGRRTSQYDGECRSYGEALLNCYLDLFITLTVSKTPREIGAKPGFLVNPATGAVLEIDVLLEDFRLGFEFQGEHHYTDPKVQMKDIFKRVEFERQKRILIPVNIVQLQGDILQVLIVNSIKDHLGLHDLLVSGDLGKLNAGSATSRQLLSFSKATQRIYLARRLFQQSQVWLDGVAKAYVARMGQRNPVSSTNPAPRHRAPAGDLEVDYIYRNLKHVTKARRQ